MSYKKVVIRAIKITGVKQRCCLEGEGEDTNEAAGIITCLQASKNEQILNRIG